MVLTRRRRPYHREQDFTRLGLDPRRADIVVVKIGYLEPELFEMAADWMLALQDPARACRALAEFSAKYPALATGRLQGQYDKDRRSVTC